MQGKSGEQAKEIKRLEILEKSLNERVHTGVHTNRDKETQRYNIVKKMIEEKEKSVEVEKSRLHVRVHVHVADLEALEAQTFFEDRKRTLTSALHHSNCKLAIGLDHVPLLLFRGRSESSRKNSIRGKHATKPCSKSKAGRSMRIATRIAACQTITWPLKRFRSSRSC
jgi:hypothetical protein